MHFQDGLFTGTLLAAGFSAGLVAFSRGVFWCPHDMTSGFFKSKWCKRERLQLQCLLWPSSEIIHKYFHNILLVAQVLPIQHGRKLQKSVNSKRQESEPSWRLGGDDNDGSTGLRRPRAHLGPRGSEWHSARLMEQKIKRWIFYVELWSFYSAPRKSLSELFSERANLQFSMFLKYGLF